MGDESGKQQRLLIVDDSRVIRVTARKILQDHFETVEAVDGDNAWDMISNNGPFNLVVTDLTMPNLDGFGLLARIRDSQDPVISKLPVIVITGANDSDTVKERATEAGATDFIGKPFDSVLLLARTQAHASAHATTQALADENFELETQARSDNLTGLANETAFMDRGFEQLSYAVRHKSSLAVFRVEIDDFNDLFKQYGQDVTDAIVKSVANVLESCIRHEDTAARVGPARFAMLLPGMNQAGIRNLADRINRDISARIIKQGDSRIRYTVSIGVAAPTIRKDMRIDELLKVADSRLTCASSNGGNQVVFDESSPTPATPPAKPVAPPILDDQAINDLIRPDADATDAPDSDKAAAAPAAATDDADVLPATFAGPVPDLSTAFPVEGQQGETRSTASAAPETEDIVITAPLDSQLDAPLESAQETPAAAQAGTSAPDVATATTPAPVADMPAATVRIEVSANNGDEAEHLDDLEAPRPGFMKRLFARLFRRNR